ncbi:hypothetical protein [Brevundimonas sp.]|uniref:hypothetical protein n=1 Tax=Brevundimonas sp. TaxID=1871086 RepID=UPI002D3BE77D|nr:hypothetical protein [Brevundimonas sp.]HYD27328.1 hypothetical protein [Brevundimonas sp.]
MTRSLSFPVLASLIMAAAATAAIGQERVSADAAQSRLAGQLPADVAWTSGLAGEAIQFRAESDSSEAAIFIGDTREGGWVNAWSLRFATPIQKGESSTNFITESGLSGSSSVRMTLSHVSGSPPFATPVAEQLTLGRQAIDACVGKSVTAAAREACSNLTFSDLREYLPEHLRSRLADPNFESANIWVWTAALEVGHQEIDWRDPLSLAEQETQRTPYALSLSGGVSLGRGHGEQPFYVGGGVELAREYPAGDSRTLCAPPPAVGPQECFTGRFGAPEARDSQVIHLVGRFQEVAGAPFAVELRPAYDLRNDVAELAATLYLVSGSDGGLRGGLRARWRTEDDDPLTGDERFTFGVFVGAPFSLGSQ